MTGVTFNVVTVGSDNVPTATFQITDGGVGDDTTANGAILSITGPAISISQIPLLAPEALAALMLLLAFVGTWILRRA